MQIEHIVVIDSDTSSCTLLEKYLKSGGYAVSCFHHGASAWQALSNHPRQTSVILLERLLPDLSSLTLLQNIKRHPQLNTIPVIMYSNQANKEERIEAFKNGIYDFLLKPLEKELLTLVIKRAIRNRQAVAMC